MTVTRLHIKRNRETNQRGPTVFERKQVLVSGVQTTLGLEAFTKRITSENDTLDVIRDGLEKGGKAVRAKAASAIIDHSDILGKEAILLVEEVLSQERNIRVATMLLYAYEYSMRANGVQIEERLDKLSNLLDTLDQMHGRFDIHLDRETHETRLLEFDTVLFGAVMNVAYPDSNNDMGPQRIKEFALTKATKPQIFKILHIFSLPEVPGHVDPVDGKGNRPAIINEIAARGDEEIKGRARTAIANLNKPGIYNADRPERIKKRANEILLELSQE